MRSLQVTRKPAQNCLMSLIALNQLKRQFEDFQTSIFEQLKRVQKESMEDLIGLWKMVGMPNQTKRLSARERERPNEQLKSALQLINEKQHKIQDLEQRLIQAQESKQQLLGILQKQTQLCTQIRDEQQSQMIAFNSKVQELQKVIQQRQGSLNELSLETTVLKRLLKQQYQSQQLPLCQTIELKNYLTNSRRQLSGVQQSKKLFRNRNSETGLDLKTSQRNKGSQSRQSKPLRSANSKLFKSVKPNQSSNSIKTQIQRIIQKAVKENYQKHR